MEEFKKKLLVLIDFLRVMDMALDLFAGISEEGAAFRKDIDLIANDDNNLDYTCDQAAKCAFEARQDGYEEIQMLIEEYFGDCEVNS